MTGGHLRRGRLASNDRLEHKVTEEHSERDHEYRDDEDRNRASSFDDDTAKLCNGEFAWYLKLANILSVVGG
jgi:hypothetical protein